MQTRSQKRKMATVVNTDAYHPFDEIYLNTVENILSDEHTYNTSFDEYKSSFMGIGKGGEEAQIQSLDGARDDEPTYERSTSTSEETGNNNTRNGRARSSGKKKSPYFAPGRVTRAKAAATQNLITRIAEDHSKSETELGVESDFATTAPVPAPEPELEHQLAPEPAPTSAHELGPEMEPEPGPEPELAPKSEPVSVPVPAPEPEPETDTMIFDKADHDGEMESDTVLVPQIDGTHETGIELNTNLPADGAGLPEDRILALLGPDEQFELLEFIESHPFMKGRGYPVGRCARRRFVGDVHGKASAVGLHQSAIDELVRFIRRIYLETWAEGHGVDDDLSEFGEEFDEDEALSKKERKRKRRAEKDKDKPRKSKKEKRSRPENRTTQTEAKKPEIINIEDTASVDTASVLPNHAPQVKVDDDLIAMVAPKLPGSTMENAVSKSELNHDSTAPASSTHSIPSDGRYSDLGSEADPIPLGDEAENEPDTRTVAETNAQKFTSAVQPAQPTHFRDRIRFNGTPHEENHLAGSDLGLRGHPISLDDDDNNNVDDIDKWGAIEEAIVSPKPPNLTPKSKKNEGKSHADVHNVTEKDTPNFDLSNEAVAVVDPALFESKTKKMRAERERQRIPDVDEILATSMLPGVMSVDEKKREKNRRKRQKRKQKKRDLKNQEQSGHQSGRQLEMPQPKAKENAENRHPISDYSEDDPMDNSNILENPHWDLDL